MSKVLRLSAAGETHPGRKRVNNEDFVAFFEPSTEQDLLVSGCLYVVADGVGGASNGERVSQFAVQKVMYEYYQRSTLPPAERLTQVIQDTSREIFEFSQKSENMTTMATTLVAAAVIKKRLVVANVGDSRAYLIRGGEAFQITHDHNLVGEMLREGLLTEREALASKVKNRLSRSLGGEPEPVVDIFEVSLLPGDRILLCTDGLTRYALTQDIQKLAIGGTPNEIVHKLVDFANKRGGADNISVIVVDVGEEILPNEWINEKTNVQPILVPISDLDTVFNGSAIQPYKNPKRRVPRNKLVPRYLIPLFSAIVLLTVATGGLVVIAITSPPGTPTPAAIATPISSVSNKPTPTQLILNQSTTHTFEPPTRQPDKPIPTYTPASTPTMITQNLPENISSGGCFAEFKGVYRTLYEHFGNDGQRYINNTGPDSFVQDYKSKYLYLVYLLVYRDELSSQEPDFYPLSELPQGNVELNQKLDEASRGWKWLLLPEKSQENCKGDDEQWISLIQPIPEIRVTTPTPTPTPTATETKVTSNLSNQ